MEAIGWVDPSSPTYEWDRAQVQQLARRLGFALGWADPTAMFGLFEQAKAAGANTVLLPSAGHVDAATMDRVLWLADIECAAPRESFGRRSVLGR